MQSQRLMLTALALSLVLTPGIVRAQAQTERPLLQRYCVTCHNDRLETGGLSLDGVDPTNAAAHADVLERVVKKGSKI